MNFAARPTYALVPEWIYPPDDGPIQLGNILSNPHDPQSVLLRIPPTDEALATSTSTLRNWHAEADSMYRAQVGVWATLAVYATAVLRARRARRENIHFTMTELETRIVQHRPTAATITRWVASVPDLREVLLNLQVLPKARMHRRPRLYFVSGIKIARNFQVVRMSSRAQAVEMALDAPIPVSVGSAGAQMTVGQGQRQTEGFCAADDIVFAYELLEIRVRGQARRRRVCETFKCNITVRRHSKNNSSSKRRQQPRPGAHLDTIVVDVDTAEDCEKRGKKAGKKGKDILVRADMAHEDVFLDDVVVDDEVIVEEVIVNDLVEDILEGDPDNEELIMEVLGDDPDDVAGGVSLDADGVSVVLSLPIDMSGDTDTDDRMDDSMDDDMDDGMGDGMDGSDSNEEDSSNQYQGGCVGDPDGVL
jgi:hypothetical protein